MRPIGAGGAVHSSRALEAHFGLGARDPVALSIRWPSGQVQRIMPVERNRLLTIEEPE